MADTNFTDEVTVIEPTWLQPINNFFYRLLGGPVTLAQLQTAIGSTPTIVSIAGDLTVAARTDQQVTGVGSSTAVTLPNGATPRDMSANSTHFWVLDDSSNNILRYTLAGVYDSVSHTTGGLSAPTALTVSDDIAYVAQGALVELRRLSDGSVIRRLDFTGAGVANIRGLAIDGDTLFALDVTLGVIAELSTVGELIQMLPRYGVAPVPSAARETSATNLKIIDGMLVITGNVTDALQFFTKKGVHVKTISPSGMTNPDFFEKVGSNIYVNLSGTTSYLRYPVTTGTAAGAKLSVANIGIMVEVGDNLLLPNLASVTVDSVVSSGEVTTSTAVTAGTQTGSTSRVNAVGDLPEIVATSPLTYALRTPK